MDTIEFAPENHANIKHRISRGSRHFDWADEKALRVLFNHSENVQICGQTKLSSTEWIPFWINSFEIFYSSIFENKNVHLLLYIEINENNKICFCFRCSMNCRRKRWIGTLLEAILSSSFLSCLRRFRTQNVSSEIFQLGKLCWHTWDWYEESGNHSVKFVYNSTFWKRNGPTGFSILTCSLSGCFLETFNWLYRGFYQSIWWSPSSLVIMAAYCHKQLTLS